MSGPAVTVIRARNGGKIVELKYQIKNALGRLYPEEFACSAFRPVERSNDPVLEACRFETGIRLLDSRYRLRFVNTPNLLDSGYEILDIADEHAEYVYLRKFKDVQDLDSNFKIRFVLDKISGDPQPVIDAPVATPEPRKQDYYGGGRSHHQPEALSRWG